MKKWMISGILCLLGAAIFYVLRTGGAEPEVKTIVLPFDVPKLAAGPGLEMYSAKCMVCHSSRYVTMQPLFPKKVWESEVAKMVKVYGAKLNPDEVIEIVAYLTATKGIHETQ